MPGNIITLKTQKALKAFLETKTTEELGGIPATSIRRGMTQDNAIVPGIVVQCDTADHAPEGIVGTWVTQARIYVRHSCDDTPEDDHLAAAGTVFDLFTRHLIADSITTAATDYTVENVIIKSQAYQAAENTWESELVLELTCCGSDLS